MKVYIGKYTSWTGPYQLADFLQKIGYTEDECHDIGEHWSNMWINSVCNWIESKKSRKVKIKLHYYDTWNMHNTTSLIIHPLLVQLKETNHGFGAVDKEDVPEFLHSTYGTEEDYATHYSSQAWQWVMDEMIWAFAQDNDEEGESQFFTHPDTVEEDFLNSVSKIECDHKGLKAYHARMSNGFRLFGKYYQNLWD